MPTVEVSTPAPEDGDFVLNPSIDWLRESVMRKGAEFWCVGAGQGSILFHADKGWRTELLITFDEELGFAFEYGDRNQARYISIRDSQDARKVRKFIGGDPFVFAAGWFIDRVLAWDIVQEFVKTGERLSRVTWIAADAVDWGEYGAPSS